MPFNNILALKNHSSSLTLKPGGKYLDDIPYFYKDVFKQVFELNDSGLNDYLINKININAAQLSADINSEIVTQLNTGEALKTVKVGFYQESKPEINLEASKMYGLQISLKEKLIGEYFLASIIFNPHFSGTGTVKLIHQNTLSEIFSQTIVCIATVPIEIKINTTFNATSNNEDIFLVFIPDTNVGQKNYSLFKTPLDEYCAPCIQNAKTPGWLEIKSIKIDSISGTTISGLIPTSHTAGFEVEAWVQPNTLALVDKYDYLFMDTLQIQTGIDVLQSFNTAKYWIENLNPLKEDINKSILELKLKLKENLLLKINHLKNIFPFKNYDQTNSHYSVQIP